MIARLAAIYRNRAITQRRSVASMPIPDDIDIDDCKEVYGDREIFDTLDDDNDCTDAGGHVYLGQCGEVRCIYCGARTA